MSEYQRFPYVEVDPKLGSASAMPYLPITLAHGRNTISVSALVDSGAALNLLPYGLGQQMGFIWDEQTARLRLSGIFSDLDARAILVSATVDRFPPVRLAFAWTRNEEVPAILGQITSSSSSMSASSGHG
jgi:hypothetical protein